MTRPPRGPRAPKPFFDERRRKWWPYRVRFTTDDRVAHIAIVYALGDRDSYRAVGDFFETEGVVLADDTRVYVKRVGVVK